MTGTPYSQMITASGGTPPYTWQITSSIPITISYAPSAYEQYRQAWIDEGDLGALALMTANPPPPGFPQLYSQEQGPAQTPPV